MQIDNSPRERDSIMRGCLILFCMATYSDATGNDESNSPVVVTEKQQSLLDADPVIKKANSGYDSDIRQAEESLRGAKVKSATKRLDALKQQLKVFTQAGDFDKAIACKSMISGIEESGVDGSRPRPKNTVKHGASTYALIKEPATWNVAKRRCEEMGGHLVCLETPGEAEWLRKFFRSNNESGWIGASDEETEGKWIWVNGLDVDARLIKSSSIDNYRDSEHWMIFSLQNDAWNDASARMPYVCEWEK